MSKERPIIMSSESVRVILDGRKTQTRRLIKPQPKWLLDGNFRYDGIWLKEDDDEGNPIEDYFEIGKCPYGKVGDRLWVKEKYGFKPRVLKQASGTLFIVMILTLLMRKYGRSTGYGKYQCSCPVVIPESLWRLPMCGASGCKKLLKTMWLQKG